MYGMISDVQLACQASYGTSNVVSLTQIPVTKENLELKIGQLLDPAMYGRYAESPRYAGPRTVAGQLDVVPMPAFLGKLLYGVCGSDSVTFAGSLATHRFRPLNTVDWDGNTALPPYSLLVNRDVGSAFLYFDLAMNDLNLDFANGQLLKATLGLIGGKYADASKVAPVFPAEKEWTWDTFSASYGGQGLSVRKGSIKLVNNLETIFLLGNSLYPAYIKRKGPVQVTGQLTLQFNANSLMGDFFTQSQPGRQLLLNFFSSVQGSASLLVDLPQTRLMAWKPYITGPGALEVPVDLVGEYNTTSSYQLQYTVTNTVAAYP